MNNQHHASLEYYHSGGKATCPNIWGFAVVLRMDDEDKDKDYMACSTLKTPTF